MKMEKRNWPDNLFPDIEEGGMRDRNGRIYFYRLGLDFMLDETIEWLEEEDKSQIYAYFYLKLCLAFLRKDGLIQRNVGERKLPCSMEYIAHKTRVPVHIVKQGLPKLEHVGLIKKMEDGRYYIPTLLEHLGSECDAARRMRRMRSRQKCKAGGVE
ncbi:phage replisome organizer N-terminal domain-containing protein [Megasphaera butyrica]|uniref:phage replisome organizer N-terminal domain-containing protein n=1 Tax=Megasphaera butyrica TaxID=2981791 RepID=UPI000820D1D5|nr:phage replisome organizer N-terminal domain-containing protein [Megasphaera butyrica]MCU6714503.1 phage replisome organizer N-terminal domain-containing protein [Megasphaera butyrica]SCH59767.1 phage replisome organizer%2C putative%2C N-terminal region [uncultured Megasphaera sp.]SCJ02523.1 phage replisome organizer%2C putative%2C N-terminal region [uncultured Ruminococcus sp.]